MTEVVHPSSPEARSENQYHVEVKRNRLYFDPEGRGESGCAEKENPISTPLKLGALISVWYTIWAINLALQSQAQTVGPTVITLKDKPTHEIPKLYGMMYEDINVGHPSIKTHSGDGGYYAEMLRNRALQRKNITNQQDALEAWSSIGNIKLSAVDLSKSLPLSEALPNALEVTVPAGQEGAIVNSGYWGMKVDKSWTYTASFYAKTATKGIRCGPKTTVRLMSVAQPARVLAKQTVRPSCLTDKWQRFEVQLNPKHSGIDANNAFTITFVSDSTNDEVIHITLASLFPPTFKNRPNGVRIDLAEATAALKQTFFRWGGFNHRSDEFEHLSNNIEGYSPDDRWKWYETVGPLTERPGRKGNWGYTNTDGFGLFEVLQFVEDLNMEFIASVWSGLNLSPFRAVPESEIDKYIQEGVDMLNFIVGPVSTKQGALRASLGHPKPFNVRFVEVGNEDFFDSNTYTYRWKHIAPVLMKQFPQLKFVATTLPNQPELSPAPFGWDIHSYNTAEWYVQHTQDYDSFPRNGPKIFQLELGKDRRAQRYIEGAVAEAAYMTGFERNSDIVEGIAYAPTLCNIQVPEASQWHPNLIDFDVLGVYPTASYYVQQMFATYLGDKYLPSNLPSKIDKLSWSATVSTSDGTVFVKLANADESDRKVSIELPFNTENQITTLTLEKLGNSISVPVKKQVPIPCILVVRVTATEAAFLINLTKKDLKNQTELHDKKICEKGGILWAAYITCSDPLQY
ncbi:family 51 glycoside hydrolase [Melampsora larici-populina 98AG31]|uniref:non-reducing end alpha-L-arabinofuranosidase n=1 Tax=Melampsora larici-populina (strain 98AG31 / pathotype 3-4-7) TaxID=747676 RepID=F4RED7_MELLP|nr:family 51 glycoside hydrolase [Melampsora larici-populina 98AG31]EGG09290.1 family 51 glycoside hydrolase [Melampsora larici-populina 98AG31]